MVGIYPEHVGRVLEACVGAMGGLCGVLSRVVHIWVMYGMQMGDTQHVFPGDGVGQLLRVCQQEAFAVHNLGCCSADCV